MPTRPTFALRTSPRAVVLATLLVFGAATLSAQSRAAGRAPLDGRGVSRELARHRSATISDVRYALALDVTAPDSAPGSVDIQFTRTGNDDLLLDYRGRRIVSVQVNGVALAAPRFDGHHLRVPAARLVAGVNHVQVGFVSEIAPSGSSIIRARDATDGSTYLYTLLVPADANQLFPCFDQPNLKARVTLSLATPIQWTALGNGSLVRADTAGDVVRSTFAETRPISTYLIAFAAGPWERRATAFRGRTIGLYVRRSRAREVDADTLLALSHRALGWMESYFGRGYPFEKFDIMLAPAFPFGGMEHPGLVMYNEDRFIFRDRPTLARRVGRFSTILHETAHQWFGDLVTMEWFDDLWLKEGFATYMGAKALAELEPSSDAWKSFYQSNKPAAYGVDQTEGTTPLWQELANLDQAKSAYGPIVYNKAPSVLKQLNFLVGEPAFQGGVRAFLATHAYGNATWADLLAAIGTAGQQPLREFGRQFMLRPGMPVVEPIVTLSAGRITRLTLRQRPAQPALSGAGPWPMRTRVLLAYADGRTERIDVALSGLSTEVVGARGKPAPAFVFPNADDYGYFLSLLDAASVRSLESGSLQRVSDPLLRSMLWGALWDQVREARMSPDRYARLVLRELGRESDEQILPTLTGRLDRTLRAYLAPSAANELRAAAEDSLWRLQGDTTRSFGVRRAFLDAFIGIASSDGGRARLLTILGADSAAGEPVRDPTRWAIVDRLLVLGDTRAEGALAAQVGRDTTPDGRRRAFTTGAARPLASAKAEYFARYFNDRALNEDWATGSLGVFNAVEHQELTRGFLRAALDSLPYIQQNRRIFFLGSWLGAFLGGQTSPEALQIVTSWLAAHPALPADLRQKVQQSADELRRTVRIRAGGANPNGITGARGGRRRR